MYFPHRVKVIRKNPDPNSLDKHGNRPTLAEVFLACRKEQTSKVVKNQQGQDVVSTTQFSFPGRLNVAYCDELQYAGVDGAVVTRSPIAVEPVEDGIGGRPILVVSC